MPRQCSVLRDAEVVLLFADGPHGSDGVGLPSVLLDRLLPAGREHPGQRTQRAWGQISCTTSLLPPLACFQGERLKIKGSGLWHGLISCPALTRNGPAPNSLMQEHARAAKLSQRPQHAETLPTILPSLHKGLEGMGTGLCEAGERPALTAPSFPHPPQTPGPLPHPEAPRTSHA